MTKLLLLLVILSGNLMLSAQQTPKPDSLAEYTGKYKFPEGSDVTLIKIVVENGALWAKSDKGDSELKPLGKDSFEVVTYTGTATFKRDDKNKVVGLHIAVGNLIMDGTRSEDDNLFGLNRQRILK